MPAETFRIKVEAAGHIDELMLVAEYDGYKSDVGNKHENDFAEDGFNYWTAFFEDSDGGYYRIKISVGLSGDSKTVYNVNDIKERSPFPPTALPQSGALMEAGASSASPETEAPGTSYASSVTQNTPDVKNSIRNRNETDTQSALRREAVSAMPSLPYGESYSQKDRQTAAVAACSTAKDQILTYAAYGSRENEKTTIAKFTAAASYSVTPELYLEVVKKVSSGYDADQNGTISQKELRKALDSMKNLTQNQKAALYQLFDVGWKTNPYGNTKDIREAYQKAKGK